MSQSVEQIRADRKRKAHAKVIKNRHAAVEIRKVNEVRLTETIAELTGQ